jgi:hypothetical protein
MDWEIKNITVFIHNIIKLYYEIRAAPVVMAARHHYVGLVPTRSQPAKLSTNTYLCTTVYVFWASPHIPHPSFSSLPLFVCKFICQEGTEAF